MNTTNTVKNKLVSGGDVFEADVELLLVQALFVDRLLAMIDGYNLQRPT